MILLILHVLILEEFYKHNIHSILGKLSVMSRPQTRVKGKKNNKPLKTPKSSRNESAKRPRSSEKKK